MKEAIYRNSFEKDVNRAKKRGKNLSKLKTIIISLLNDETLPLRNRDHRLSGKYVDHRECHIEPDWLLIYKKIDNAIIFERTGSHADLFKM